MGEPEDARLFSVTESYIVIQNFQPMVITHKIKCIYNADMDEYDVEYLFGTTELPRFLVGFDQEFNTTINSKNWTTLLFSRGDHNSQPAYPWSGNMYIVDPDNFTTIAFYTPMDYANPQKYVAVPLSVISLPKNRQRELIDIYA